jgi:integrase
MKKRQWTTVAPGIRRDQFGQHEVRAKVRGVTHYMPAALVRGADVAAMQRWQDAEERKIRKLEPLEAPANRRAPREARGTLEGDVLTRFLPQIAGRVSFKSDRSHARAWFLETGRNPKTPLGQMHRDAITHEDINIVIARWQKGPTARAVRRIRVAAYERAHPSALAAPNAPSKIGAYERATPATSGQVVAARTIIHRCRVLAECYHTLDGAQAPTPCDEAKIPSAPRGQVPPTVDLETIIAVARNLAAGDPATYGRFLVLNTTAQRPCQVGRARPKDVKLKMRLWTVRDAKGAPGHTVTLSDDGVAAWRVFIAADAWGEYDTTEHARRVHEAGWPVGVRPYAARHSLVQAALEKGVALDQVQGLVGHRSPVTTRQFYGPLAIPEKRHVTDRLAGRLASVFRPKAVKGGRARTKKVPRGTSTLRAVPAKPQAAPRRKARALPPFHTTQAAGKGRK